MLSALELAISMLGTPASRLACLDDWADYFQPDVPPDVCCANFVSACLVKANAVAKYAGSPLASQLLANLLKAGWLKADAADSTGRVNTSMPYPGDVFFFAVPGHPDGDVPHHVLFFVYADARGPVYIGMNNVLYGGQQLVSAEHIGYKVVAALRQPASPSGEFQV